MFERKKEMKKAIYYFLVIIFIGGLACKGKPKVITPVVSIPETGAHSSLNSATSTNQNNLVHEVVVDDFMHTSRYTYLQVSEDDNQYWIAIPGTDVEKGDTYYFQGGIKMQNFYSKEYDRTFETLLLVGGVSKDPIVSNGYMSEPGSPTPNLPVTPVTDMEPLEGGVSLSELFDDPTKYKGKSIKIKGQCIKVNQNIMSRNWVHLQDGGTDEENNPLDLTVTTQLNVPVGSIIALEGTISLNKDFGAGYRYDVIMEEAQEVVPKEINQ